VFFRYLKADMLNKKIKEVDYKRGDRQLPNSDVKLLLQKRCHPS